MKRSYLVLALLGVLLLLGGWRYRGRIIGVYHTLRAVADSRPFDPSQNFTDLIFVHHSTGRGLILQGNLRPLLTEAGYEFWDQDYNAIGLTGPDGRSTGYGYNIPHDNTDPDGYVTLFRQSLYQRPWNAFSGIMQHQVIVFKSCFPNSNMESDDRLAQYQAYYRQIRDVAAAYPDHLFILLTSPPLEPGSTTPENAARARALATWLQSPEFLSGYTNFYVFDFFGRLAENDPTAADYNMLRAAYRPETAGDSHPNQQANEIIAPELAQFIQHTAVAYRDQQ